VLICCTSCNNALSPLENDLSAALRTPSAALRARDAENKPIRAEIEADGKTYDYSDGVGIERMPPPKYDRGTRSLMRALPGGADAQAEVIAKMLWGPGPTAE
jgi:hypothetical protein